MQSIQRKKLLTVFLVITLAATSIYITYGKQKPFTTLSQYQSQKLDWRKCYNDFSCATLRVPIDYSNLQLGQFRLSLLRASATQPKKHLGTLVVNPGGPGASGVDFAYAAEAILSSAIRAHFDILGFDPRGVSRSAPIRCLNAAETDAMYAADSKPDNPQELAQLGAEAKSIAAKCAAHTRFLAHYSTTDSARDMDILRSALREEKLNFFGKSYGTYLGALYTQLFPTRVGKFVLDGAIDPKATISEQSIAQAIGFDSAFAAFVKDCISKSNCPFTSAKSALKEISTLLNQLAKNPLPTDSKRNLTESLAVLGMAQALYDSTLGWSELRAALTQAKSGNGTKLLALAEEYARRNPDGTYTDNETDANLVIGCLDWHDDRSINQLQVEAITITKSASLFGPYLSFNGSTCWNLPKQTNPAPAFTSPTNASVLIIGTTGDPATPYKWAQGLQRSLKNSLLLTFNGNGHTGQGRGSACVDKAVDAYLLSTANTLKNLTCTA
jgi:pimeloyl-ACP methyl ester carboxylesterase